MWGRAALFQNRKITGAAGGSAAQKAFVSSAAEAGHLAVLSTVENGRPAKAPREKLSLRVLARRAARLWPAERAGRRKSNPACLRRLPAAGPERVRTKSGLPGGYGSALVLFDQAQDAQRGAPAFAGDTGGLEDDPEPVLNPLEQLDQGEGIEQSGIEQVGFGTDGRFWPPAGLGEDFEQLFFCFRLIRGSSFSAA